MFLGGFKSVINVQFLQESNIGHIVNTAKGLEIFGPKYTVECVAKKLLTYSFVLVLDIIGWSQKS